MSRSYKKNPFAPDTPVSGSKRLANKKVRRAVNRGDEETQNRKGTSYKKLFESWDIRDYSFYGGTFEEFYHHALIFWVETGLYPGRGKRHDTPPSREYCKNIYDRWYKRK